MDRERVVVRCYEGSRGAEEPRAFTRPGAPGGGGALAVRAILDRWQESGARAGAPLERGFRIEAEDGRVYRLAHLPVEDAWYLTRG